MASYILDEAGYVTGTYEGPGQPASSTSIPPPDGAAIPLQFVAGAWLMPAEANSHVSLLAFYNRFTQAERVAIRYSQARDFTVADFMMLVGAAKYIDLANQDTQMGVAYLVSVGLLTQERAAAILGAPIADGERP